MERTRRRRASVGEASCGRDLSDWFLKSLNEEAIINAPHFVVIGAMKSGTTTLYHDLILNPGIYLPDKETNGLAREISLSEYQSSFKRARPGQICGDVSTVYAMLPDSVDVVPRAARFLAPETKIVYVVREPVSRTLSHHNHMRTWPGPTQMGPDINVEIHRRPELIQYSRYAMQLRPWIDQFGPASVHVIVFEEYVRQRKAAIAKLSSFLGVEPQVDRIDENTVHNQSAGKPVASGFWLGLAESPLYRKFIRPFTSLAGRDLLRKWLLPKTDDEERVAPTAETIDTIISAVRADVAELSRLLGSASPLWNLDHVRRKYVPTDVEADASVNLRRAG